MTPAQARAFLAVAVTGSFTAAARQLALSQPTITSQVKGIERRYNVELFYRGSRGVRLTPTGETLLAIVRRMFGSYDEAVAYLEETRGLRRGHLRIGSYGPYDAIDMVAQFTARCPGIQTTVVFANSHDLPGLLRNYEIDVAVLARIDAYPDFSSVPLAAKQLVAIAPRKDKWMGRKSIRASDLAAERLVLREEGSAARVAFEQLLLGEGLTCAEFVEVGSREGVVAAVASGLGLSAIFDEGLIPEDRIVKLAITNCRIRSQIDVVCLRERAASPTVQAFMGVVKKHID